MAPRPPAHPREDPLGNFVPESQDDEHPSHTDSTASQQRHPEGEGSQQPSFSSEKKNELSPSQSAIRLARRGTSSEQDNSSRSIASLEEEIPSGYVAEFNGELSEVEIDISVESPGVSEEEAFAGSPKETGEPQLDRGIVLATTSSSAPLSRRSPRSKNTSSPIKSGSHQVHVPIVPNNNLRSCARATRTRPNRRSESSDQMDALSPSKRSPSKSSIHYKSPAAGPSNTALENAIMIPATPEEEESSIVEVSSSQLPPSILNEVNSNSPTIDLTAPSSPEEQIDSGLLLEAETSAAELSKGGEREKNGVKRSSKTALPKRVPKREMPTRVRSSITGGVGSSERKEVEAVVSGVLEKMLDPQPSHSNFPKIILTTVPNDLLSGRSLIPVTEPHSLTYSILNPRETQCQIEERHRREELQTMIETPKWRTYDPLIEGVEVGAGPPAGPSAGGRAKRITADVEEDYTTTKPYYKALHKKYEIFEKKQQRIEKERLVHERYKIKERLEYFRNLAVKNFTAFVSSALLTIDLPIYNIGGVERPTLSNLPFSVEEVRTQLITEAEEVLFKYDQYLPADAKNRPKGRVSVAAGAGDESASEAASTPPPQSTLVERQISNLKSNAVHYAEASSVGFVTTKNVKLDAVKPSPPPSTHLRKGKRKQSEHLEPGMVPYRRHKQFKHADVYLESEETRFVGGETGEEEKEDDGEEEAEVVDDVELPARLQTQYKRPRLYSKSMLKDRDQLDADGIMPIQSPIKKQPKKRQYSGAAHRPPHRSFDGPTTLPEDHPIERPDNTLILQAFKRFSALFPAQTISAAGSISVATTTKAKRKSLVPISGSIAAGRKKRQDPPWGTPYPDNLLWGSTFDLWPDVVAEREAQTKARNASALDGVDDVQVVGGILDNPSERR